MAERNGEVEYFKYSKHLIERGVQFNRIGFWAFVVGLIYSIIIFIIFISRGYIDFGEDIFLILPAIVVCGGGISLYFKGLNLVGLGQIAKNTDEE